MSTMVSYQMFHEDPLFEYVLVSFGSGLLLIVFLLLCGKKEKEEAPRTQTINVNGYPVPSACENVTVDVEDPIVAVQVTEVQSTSEGPLIRQLSSTSSPMVPTETSKYQPSIVQHPTPDSVNPVASITTCDAEIASKERSNPYARVQTNSNVILPKYEYSGNSENSGNSLYAKVQDVKREETAYAVVDIKDKDYDFVNGVLVRRKTVDKNEENTTAAPGMDLYDTPVSPPMLKLPDEEIENSGTSGIYEIVPECEAKSVKSSNELKDVSSGDIYDSCGPGGLEGLNSTPPAAPPRDSPPHDLNNTLTVESTVVRRGSSKEKLNGKSHKSDTNEKHEHDEKQKGGLFKSIKFGHSRKHKKTDEHQPSTDMTASESCHVMAVDITLDVGSNQLNTGEDGSPPPLPSVDKLMHISAHRKQHSQSDINPSPDATASDSSPSESPSNPDHVIGHPFSCHERPYNNDIHNQSQQLQESPSPSYRGENQRTLEPITKTKSSTQSSTHTDMAKDIKYPALTGQTSISDIDTRSLLSEPDYAEITSSESVVRVKESSFDLLPGYTCIEYGNPDDERNFARKCDHEDPSVMVVVNREVDAPTYHISGHETQCKINDDDDYPDYDEVVSASINSEMRYGVRNSRKSDKCTTNLDNDINSSEDGCDVSSWSNVPNSVLSGHKCFPGLDTADADVGVSVDSDYAAIDFSARDEERRIKNLYAAVDFSSKKSCNETINLEEEVEDALPGFMYEGTYNTIPERQRIPTTECLLHDNSVEANPLYEEVPTQIKK